MLSESRFSGSLSCLESGNFIDLINQKYYDGLYIHRIVKDYCIQFGCPNAINPHVYVSQIVVDVAAICVNETYNLSLRTVWYP